MNCTKSNISKPQYLFFKMDFKISQKTGYLFDMFLYAKLTVGSPISAHIKHITLALIQTDIERKIGVTFFKTTCTCSLIENLPEFYCIVYT
jgi:hypothetical protein